MKLNYKPADTVFIPVSAAVKPFQGRDCIISGSFAVLVDFTLNDPLFSSFPTNSKFSPNCKNDKKRLLRNFNLV